MARRRKGGRVNVTGRNDQTERFAAFRHSFLVSEAFRSLDTVARSLLIDLAMLENGKNNGSLWLSVADATDRLGIADQRAAMRAFNDLQDRGLIAMTKEAHFSIKAAETSRARCWRLTWLSWDGKPPSHDWKDYVAPAKTKARKSADRGLQAMARYRKMLAANKVPVVDSSALPPILPHSAVRTAEEFAAANGKNGANPPKSVPAESAVHPAVTMGYGSN